MRPHRLLAAIAGAVAICCPSIVAAPVASADPARVCASPGARVVGLPDEFIAGGEALGFTVSITNDTPRELPFVHYVGVTDWSFGAAPARHASLEYRSPETGDWLAMPLESVSKVFEIRRPPPQDTTPDSGPRSTPWVLASGATLTLDVRLAFDAAARFPPGGVVVTYGGHIVAGEWTWGAGSPPCDLTVVPAGTSTPDPADEAEPNPATATGAASASDTPPATPPAARSRPTGAASSSSPGTATIAARVGIAVLGIVVAVLILLRRRRGAR